MATRSEKGGSAEPPLGEYRKKRDPARTPEPMGRRPRRGKGLPAFVIQEHHARSLHWDLRLERDGVMVSWALPKGLPESPKRNHLAVHTEDHPLEYATFEGQIPEGEYGAGRMTIWDTGHYDTEKWSDSEVKIVLHGARADGGYVLFQTDGRNWMIHRHGAPDQVDEMPTSIAPMLAVQGSLPTDGGDWAFEVKWDGVRALLFVEGGRVQVHSRNDRDVTTSFPELAELGEYVGMTSCVIDGEIVAFGEDGRPSFANLQQRLNISNAHEARRRSRTDPVRFVAFDLPYVQGRSLLTASYDERRAELEALQLEGQTFTTAESFRDVPGQDVLQATIANGLEGVVVKRRSAPYRPGRRVPDWIKVKTFKSQDVVVGGWTPGRGERVGGLGALLLGLPGPDGLRYVGKVGTGFSDADRQQLLELLDPLRSAAVPFTEPVPATDAKSATFVRPEVVGEVSYAHWTNAGRLRHPVWRGLRLDKSASEVTLEEDRVEGDGAVDDPDPGDTGAAAEQSSAGPTSPGRRGAPKPSARSESVRVTVGGQELSVSNLDKVLYPATGFTKGQLIDYYVRAATAMLPHIRDRVLTMKRFPDGVEGKFFFEKHVPSHAPKWVRTVTVPSESHGSIDYAVVDDLPTLVWAANLGAIEFHVPLWSAGRSKSIPSNPDFIVFDLDPGEGTSIIECCKVAELVVPLLERQGHEACAKTSGMKGLQLYAKVSSRTSWEDVRDQARAIAQQLEKENPRLVVSKMTKALRKGRVLIDWSQNHPAKTTIAVYSVRAFNLPTVSTPVTLAEVHDGTTRGDPSRLRFDTDAVLERIERLGDLFAPVLKN